MDHTRHECLFSLMVRCLEKDIMQKSSSNQASGQHIFVILLLRCFRWLSDVLMSR